MNDVGINYIIILSPHIAEPRPVHIWTWILGYLTP